MSLHIGAKPGDIANTVLIAGDPLRAKYVAEHILTDSVCYTEVRGMLGFTGFYNGKRVSVQGTGMGIPSTSIYIHELVHSYNVSTIIRIGTCGGLHQNLAIGNVILATGACTDSQVNRLFFKGMDYAPTANFGLLNIAFDAAGVLNIPVHMGNVLSSDTFYNPEPDYWKIWADHEVLGIEMETSALYTLAARYHFKALSILSVSDNLVTGQISSAEERQNTFTDMTRIALGLL